MATAQENLKIITSYMSSVELEFREYTLAYPEEIKKIEKYRKKMGVDAAIAELKKQVD